jgi:peptidoglycan/xylan/chitin deacetylase (PgdA/CDA1 family)
MNVQRFVRGVAAASCRSLLLVARAERANRHDWTILCYHRVLPSAQKKKYFLPDLVVTPNAFERQCAALIDRFHVLPLSDAFELWRTATRTDRPLASVTFDDGYQDNFQFAAPILAKHGILATFFVITDLIGTPHLPWYDLMGQAARKLAEHRGDEELNRLIAECAAFARLDGRRGLMDSGDLLAEAYLRMAKQLAPLRRKELLEQLCEESGVRGSDDSMDQLMNWSQIQQLVEAGHEIGSHSQTHEILPLLDDSELRHEVVKSKRMIEGRLNRPVRSFCYPNGDADDRVIDMVKSAGYACAVGVDNGTNGQSANPFVLRRSFIHEERLMGLTGQSSRTLLRMHLAGLSPWGFRRKQHD